MTPRSPLERERDPALEGQHEHLLARLDRTERRLLQVENALRGVTRRTSNLSIAGPCSECNRSLLLVDHELMYCPTCGHRQPL